MPFIIKRNEESLSFQVYVTDTLHAIAENTATPAAAFTDGKSGKVMTSRWADRDRTTPKKETRTAEEIIDHIRIGLAAL